jgi:hypothetical protein
LKTLWRILFFLLVALALLAPPSARAAENVAAPPVAAPPLDAPLALPSVIKVPPVPANYQKKDLGWLQLYYLPGLHERVQSIVQQADDVKAKLGDELGQAVLDHVEVRVTRTPEEMAQLAPLGLPPPSYAAGVAYPAIHLVLLTLQSPTPGEAPDLDEVFRHELAHIALDDATLGHHVPRWFNEGLAIYESGERGWARIKTLGDASLSKTLLPLSELDQGFPQDHFEVNIAYAQSADFVRFLMRKADHERFSAMIERVRKGQAFDSAAADAYGSDLRKLEYQWREDLSRRFTIWPALLGGSAIWVFVIGALLVGWIRKRRRAKAILARWEKEEALEDAIAKARHDALQDAALADDAVLGSRSKLPKIEHDGRWYTLH